MDAPRLTRRRLLAGGVMTALGAGTAGVLAAGGGFDGLTGACGEDGERPPRADPPSTIERGVLSTRNADEGRAAYVLSRPPVPAVGLLVFLPGRGGPATSAEELGLPDLCAPRGLAVASIDAGETYFHRRADGRDGKALVLEDLLGLANERLGRLPRVIMGTSMGGYGAALLASEAPRAFRGAIVSSGAIFLAGQDRAPGAFDGPDDFARHDVVAQAERLRGMPLRIDCGSADPFLRGNRALARATGATAAFPAGCHDRGFWRRVAPAQVAFAAQVLSGGSASPPSP